MINISPSQHFNSFNDLGVAMGLKPVTRVTKDQNKLNSQREKFCEKHLCPACKQPMVYLQGTSVMACQNPSCKGVKNTIKDAEGNETVFYSPSFDLLQRTSTDIADTIFGGMK